MEEAFEHVPTHVTEVRYGDTFLRFRKRGDDRFDVFAKNVCTDYRLHLYMKDNEWYGIITREPADMTPRSHGEPFVMLDLFSPLIEHIKELFDSIETVSREDHRFAGKNVQLASFHKFRFGQIRRGMAYIEADLEYREYKFEHIDLDLPQIGVMKGWFGRDRHGYCW